MVEEMGPAPKEGGMGTSQAVYLKSLHQELPVLCGLAIQDGSLVTRPSSTAGVKCKHYSLEGTQASLCILHLPDLQCDPTTCSQIHSVGKYVLSISRVLGTRNIMVNK